MRKGTNILRILPKPERIFTSASRPLILSQNQPVNAFSIKTWGISCFLSALFFALPTVATELWVAPQGDDHNSGNANSPLGTLAAAQIKARALRRLTNDDLKSGTHIILRGGIYPLTAPLIFLPEDSGTETAPTLIEAASNETPILSGAINLTGWKKLFGTIPGLPTSARDHVWVAEVPTIKGDALEFRQLWVNDAKAIRAREPNTDQLARLVGWDKTNERATIPSQVLASLTQPMALEMVIDQVWEIAELRVKSIQIIGTNAMIAFKSPESKIEFEHPWPPVIVDTNYHAPFFLVNAIEFLDSPGEWFEDVHAKKIYYWPRADEDLTTAKVFAPTIETLVKIEGAPNRPVANLEFHGLTFAHTTWRRPSEQGHVPLQAGMFLLDAHKLKPKGTDYHRGLDNVAWIGHPTAAVSVESANHISFVNCVFEHTAAAGLDLVRHTHDDLVEGCIFRDLGGNGLQLGTFSDTNIETHVPYQPSNENEICTRETIANNVVRDCGTEDWGSVGIVAGYVREIKITHNEIFNLPYTGISVGWGWTKATNAMRDNLIFANRVQHVGQRLGDLGGIYTLSAQPGTVIAENAINDLQPSPFAPDPNHWFYLYLDEGSSFITVRDNWCPAEKFLKNANGPGNIWTNNGPLVSEKIKNAAGLEPAFQSLLSKPLP